MLQSIKKDNQKSLFFSLSDTLNQQHPLYVLANIDLDYNIARKYATTEYLNLDEWKDIVAYCKVVANGMTSDKSYTLNKLREGKNKEKRVLKVFLITSFKDADNFNVDDYDNYPIDGDVARCAVVYMANYKPYGGYDVQTKVLLGKKGSSWKVARYR